MLEDAARERASKRNLPYSPHYRLVFAKHDLLTYIARYFRNVERVHKNNNQRKTRSWWWSRFAINLVPHNMWTVFYREQKEDFRVKPEWEHRGTHSSSFSKCRTKCRNEMIIFCGLGAWHAILIQVSEQNMSVQFPSSSCWYWSVVLSLARDRWIQGLKEQAPEVEKETVDRCTYSKDENVEKQLYDHKNSNGQSRFLF